MLSFKRSLTGETSAKDWLYKERLVNAPQELQFTIAF
jgi:hypothetical protein